MKEGLSSIFTRRKPIRRMLPVCDSWLGRSNVVMEVVYQLGGYVILCQDRARRLGSKNVLIEVVCQRGGYLILCQDRAR